MSELTTLPKPGQLPLSKAQQRKAATYACDGVPRYTVKGRPSTGRLPYGQAREATLAACGCPKNEDGGHTFNAEGIRRVGRLNDHYLRVARAFIIADYQKRMQEKARQLGEAVAAAAKAKEDAARAAAPAGEQPPAPAVGIVAP